MLFKMYVILTQLVNMLITVLLSFPDLGYNFAEVDQIKDSCYYTLITCSNNVSFPGIRKKLTLKA